MFDPDRAAALLLESELIDRDWIIDGTLAIGSSNRRNRNFRVEGPGAGFLVKQPKDARAKASGTLQREARFLEFCGDEACVCPAVRFIPRIVRVDIEQPLLVVELFAPATTLWSYLEGRTNPDLGIEAARSLGRALAAVHSSFAHKGPQFDPQSTWLPRSLPWALRLHRPGPGILADLSQANAQLIRILQTEDGLCERLDALYQEWRPETLIHGDIKLDNVVIRARDEETSDSNPELWIVDWEMVQVGDPAWDLGGALHDYLVFWVSSMPLVDELTADEMVAQARVPLALVRNATRALWYGYRAAAALENACASEFLLRGVRFSAVRLIQSAFERLYQMDRLAGPPVLLLQLSANLLADPQRGQVHLYGIPLECPVP